MTYVQAIVIALFQGVTELFPVSSLGHSVLLPAWIGGNWQTLVTQSSEGSSESSFYLAYIVALHVATALALLWFFRADWVRIIRGLFRSSLRMVKARKWSINDADERLAWMLVIATIPVGLTGLALEHTFRTIFAKPLAAAIFLFINGLILLGGEVLRRGVKARGAGVGVTDHSLDPYSEQAAIESDANIAQLSFKDALYVGILQIASLFAGVSRSGVTIVGGLWRGLNHEDAARFGFLLATPIIFAAGLLKLPSLAGPAGAHIHGQVIVGFLVCGATAYLSVRFLVRYFETRTLTPFAIYCLVVGAASALRFGIG
ncbi:MAG: undecaprenyl-diphosphate phosphatase [Acidimicrobiales bacterium]